MKKKYLWWLCALPIAASPAFLALSYCSPLETSVKQITGDATGPVNLVNLKKAKPSLKSLLYGDKHYNKGNYVVIIGTSNARGDQSLNSFLFGQDKEGFWDNTKEKDMVVNKDAEV
ncbi:MAG: hypothetical protein LBM72_03090, partial [Mycoplasmataceae bacterium]|nr:hypothetical protein [Mycoplasmataceae bacterium]